MTDRNAITGADRLGRALLLAFLTTAPILLSTRGALAQKATSPVDAMRLDVSRQRLEAIEADLEQPSHSGKKAHDPGLLDAIRHRLQDGDFRPGDRIALSVQGESELTDTFTVAPGPSLNLPTVGKVDLHGVLASELTERLTREIGGTLRDPLVTAQPLVQLSVLGNVAKPGFYLVPPNAPLSDVLMQAGGPTQAAKVEKIRIERGPRSSAEEALSRQPDDGSLEALSVDELGLRTGDRIVVPGSSGLSTRDVVQFAILGLTTVVSLTQLLRHP